MTVRLQISPASGVNRFDFPAISNKHKNLIITNNLSNLCVSAVNYLFEKFAGKSF